MRAAVLFLLVGLGGCASAPTERLALRERRVVARDLANPRGVLARADGSVLLAEAGRGDPSEPSGRILRLTDANGDGDFDDAGERAVLLDAQPSVNILGRVDVKRDEVFGLADLAPGPDGQVLASHADPLEGSRVFAVPSGQPGAAGAGAPGWRFRTRGNANSLAYHPGRATLFAVQSFENAVIELPAARRVVRFDPLPDGQDAVPAAIEVDPATGDLLVALFSGQVGGDEGGSGVDFVERSGAVVRVDPGSGASETVVAGLNAPIDIALHDGTLYVLELCDAFRDPVPSAAGAATATGHGGFVRFSGRLLAVRLDRPRERVVLARGLDLPTNLCRLPDGRFLVTCGQGTPGRSIPGPDGPTVIEGRLIEVAAGAAPGRPRE